jgi:hypothetical protein
MAAAGCLQTFHVEHQSRGTTPLLSESTHGMNRDSRGIDLETNPVATAGICHCLMTYVR